jgi:hypothetical protein
VCVAIVSARGKTELSVAVKYTAKFIKMPKADGENLEDFVTGILKVSAEKLAPVEEMKEVQVGGTPYDVWKTASLMLKKGQKGEALVQDVITKMSTKLKKVIKSHEKPLIGHHGGGGFEDVVQQWLKEKAAPGGGGAAASGVKMCSPLKLFTAEGPEKYTKAGCASKVVVKQNADGKYEIHEAQGNDAAGEKILLGKKQVLLCRRAYCVFFTNSQLLRSILCRESTPRKRCKRTSRSSRSNRAWRQKRLPRSNRHHNRRPNP